MRIFGTTLHVNEADLISGIFELPTRSPRKYRGNYPERVHNFSLGQVCHFELNNGRRFVALSSFVADMPRLGDHVSKIFKPIGPIPTMTVKDYMGVLLMIRLVRALKVQRQLSPVYNIGKAISGEY